MFKSKSLITSWLATAIFIGMNVSCSKDSTQQPAHLQVTVTDSPGDYQEVNIDIQDVQVNSDSSSGGWKSLTVVKGIYNLLKLTNGLDTLLGKGDLPAGKLTQLRLVLGTNNTIKIADQVYNLTTPSAQQSGLKILLNTTLQAGITYKVTLDFDAARSIVSTGSGAFILKPVIRSSTQAESGAISGTVTPVASTPAVYAIIGSDTIATTFADQTSGKFLLNALSAGTYTVSFVPKTGYQSKTVDTVKVTVGNVTNMGTVTISQ